MFEPGQLEFPRLTYFQLTAENYNWWWRHGLVATAREIFTKPVCDAIPLRACLR